MSFFDHLYAILTVSVIAERATEVLKPIYLRIKNRLLKKDFIECSKLEKLFMSMLFGIIVSIVMKVGIDIPLVSETVLVQQIFAGLVSSYGSNILHLVLSILTEIKNGQEAVNSRKRLSGR